MLGQLFQVLIHFHPCHLLHRRQETIFMPKYEPLDLELNKCEKSLWLGCRNFTQCFRVQFVFWLYIPYKAVWINHYVLIARELLVPSWKQVRDAEDLFSSFSWKMKFNVKKNCNQNGNLVTGGLPWSVRHFWHGLWFFTVWSFPFCLFFLWLLVQLFLIPCLFCITSACSLAVSSVHFSVQYYK